MTIREQLDGAAAQRVLLLDGAMGTMIQKLRLSEDDYRGKRFAGHGVPLRGCNDLLCITRPDAISAIHEAYLRAGADIIETNSFNATSVSLADYGLEGCAYEISVAAAKVARQAADAFSTTDRPRFVAGILGPTSKTASISPDVNDGAARSVTWDELEAAYYDNARGLLDGGADILMVETIFDTLNAKAALAAIARLAGDRGRVDGAVGADSVNGEGGAAGSGAALARSSGGTRPGAVPLDIPVMISGSIVDAAGRTLSGQTVEADRKSVV